MVSLVITLLLTKLTIGAKKRDFIARTVSVAVFAYKLVYFAYVNVKGTFSVPVEISTISYFLLPIIITFKIKKLYNVGAFFGMISGLGFFAYYSIFGFTMNAHHTLIEVLIGCFCHGYLLLCGAYLFFTNRFERKTSSSLWITILAILCWAMVFFDEETRGVTFVYFLIKPEFLNLFAVPVLNALLKAVYYAALSFGYYGVTRLFYALNAKWVKDRNDEVTYSETNVAA